MMTKRKYALCLLLGIVCGMLVDALQTRNYCVTFDGDGLAVGSHGMACTEQTKIGHWLYPRIPGSQSAS